MSSDHDSDSSEDLKSDGESDDYALTLSRRNGTRAVKSRSKRGGTAKGGTPDFKTVISEIARVSTLATDMTENLSDAEQRLSQVDGGIMEKIRKMFALAQHSGTGEAEAKAALRVASSLMSKVNITQADVMAHETAAEQSQRAGMSTVVILPNPDFRRRKRGGKLPDAPTVVQNKGWHETCSFAMQKFFDVKAYSTQWSGEDPKMEWTFYGIAANTTAAAYAFEMVHNTILTWSHEHSELKGIVAHNSYRSGVAQGLVDTADAEKKAEERQAIENEKKAVADRVVKEEQDRQAELARLRDPVDASQSENAELGASTDNGTRTCGVVQPTDRRVKVEEVDDEDALSGNRNARVKKEEDERVKQEPEVDDTVAMDLIFEVAPDFAGSDSGDDDYDAVARDLQARWDEVADVPPPARRITPELPKVEVKEEPAAQNGWQSAMQLTTFRSTAERIADDYLKASKIKVGSGRKRPAGKLDRGAYAQGKKDSKKIDVKRRRLEDGA